MKLELETVDLLGHLGTAWRESIEARRKEEPDVGPISAADLAAALMPSPPNEVALRKAIREIGQTIHDQHGFEAMQDAHDEVWGE